MPAARHIRPTSPSAQTTSSASTTCATTWPRRPTTSCSECTTMPSSMRSIPCSSTMPARHSSSPVPCLRARSRCSNSTSRSSRNSWECRNSWPHSTSLRPRSSLPRGRPRTTRRRQLPVSSRCSVPTRLCPRTNRSSSSSPNQASRPGCSPRRRYTWRTTTNVCLRPWSRSTSS